VRSYIFTERRLLGRWLEGARGILLPGGEAHVGEMKKFFLEVLLDG